ncbi:MAG: virulence protein RhuM/Fic/DOC family protein [Syntrophaceae bacterium]|nr:virulence protein RhuM/Fic/DOC family protein [Syntrophaceae bacterium]
MKQRKPGPNILREPPVDYRQAVAIYESPEGVRVDVKLERNSIVAFYATVQEEGRRSVEREIEFCNLFGREKDNSLKGALGAVMQTFDGREVYPGIEEKAASLLYFLIKDHPFLDGNKRIGAALFPWFLEKNDALYGPERTCRFALSRRRIRHSGRRCPRNGT